jgi:RNA polymerase sigma-70 factor, ECF subfamily
MAPEALALRRVHHHPRVAPALTARAERVLIGAAQRGDQRALERLFREHWPACHRAATLITRDAAAAEDIAQEAFLAAFAALDRFDRSRPFGPWLRRIVANRSIDLVRARAARREVDDGPEGDRSSAGPAVSDDVLAALAALPHEQRLLVVLRHLLELTPSEIAGLTALPVGTVNSRLRRGLDALRPALEGRNDGR